MHDKYLAAMLGWGNTPPTEVLERDLREKLRRLEILTDFWVRREVPPEDLALVSHRVSIEAHYNAVNAALDAATIPLDLEITNAARVRYLASERDLYQKERDKLKRTISLLADWTHQFGEALCPVGPDTFGEGMREAKRQVARILCSCDEDDCPACVSRAFREAK